MLKIIFYAMGVLLGISLLAKLISAVTIRKMVKEAAKIQKSDHKLMKLIKAKFEHASMVSDRVQNVGAFVDKYLYEYKICGIRLHTWQNIPKRGFFIIVILGVFTVCESFRVEGMTMTTAGYIQWTGIFLLLLLLIQFVSVEKAQLKAARNYMVDYLENVCVHRYAKKHQMTEEASSEAVQEDILEEENVTEEVPATMEEVKVEEQVIPQISEEEKRSQQEIRIRAILEEFLA